MVQLNVPRFKLLTLLIISAFLVVGGCLSINLNEKKPKCGPPGTLAGHPCFYNLTIIQIDHQTRWVRGKVPEKVLEHNAEHSAKTRLGGILGYKLTVPTYPFFEYTFQVENLDDIREDETYEFRSKPNTSILEKKGPAKYPDCHPDQTDCKKKQAKNVKTELYAGHRPECCMCGWCESDCVCPGEGGCPWCGVPDSKTLLANASTTNGTMDIRVARGWRKLSATTGNVTETFMALMSGSRARGNISVKFIGYKYDQRFVPSCLAKSAWYRNT
jgi:hypothetical protein